MEIYVTRDSVSAGDDVEAPHPMNITIDKVETVDSLLEALNKIDYLPQVSGGHATWTLSSALPLAVFAQEWSAPKKVSSSDRKLESLDFESGVLNLHFSYHAQTSPEDVLSVLKRVRLKAIK